MRQIFLTLLLALSTLPVFAQKTESGYGNTIMSVAPLQVTTYTSTGIGFHLEHFIGQKQKFSLYLPFAYSFGHPDPCFSGYTAHMFYAFPGVKYYPAGSAKKVSYSIGLSAGIGRGNGHQSWFDCGNGLTQDEMQHGRTYQIFQAGALINNGLNITLNKRFYIGLEAGLGYTFLNQDGYYDNERTVMLQGAFKVGYRL